MSQTDVQAAKRQQSKRLALQRALEYGIAGAIESQGGFLSGIAIRYEPQSCLLTIKAKFEGKVNVAFVGSDTMENCLLKVETDARNVRLHWRPCKYHQNDV